MAPSFDSHTTASLRAHIGNATSGDKPKLPGAILHIVDANANTLFSHAAGAASSNSLFILHSVTKIIGAITFLQLSDRGLVSLDDASLIETHLPELAAKKVLTGSTTTEDGTKTWLFEPRKYPITPRMLMNHTYGGGHSYFNMLLHEYLQAQGTWEAHNEARDFYGVLLDSPLLWQPGTHTNYGQGFDWLAVLIERVTKRSLVDVLQEGIFGPLGLEMTGFEGQYGGNVGGRKVFWPRSLKSPEEFVAIDPPVLEMTARSDAFPGGEYHVHPLGTGLVSCASDIVRILTILLPQNAGVDPVTSRRILSEQAVEEITSPQLAAHLRNDCRNVPTAVPTTFYPADLQQACMDPDGSFGLGCGVQGADRVLEGGKRGRSGESVYWYGAANTEFWVDGEKGVVVVVEGNYFPWNDGDWVKFVADVEGLVYEGLEA